MSIHAIVEELNDIEDVNAPTPSDNQALTWDAATSKWIPEAPVPAAHKTTHQDGGADEVSIEGLAGTSAELAAHGVNANAHHTKYTDAEAVTAMGVKGDANPLNHDKYTLELHAASHQNAGGDEISVAGLSGELADNQPPKAHAASHTNGTDDIQDAGLAQKGIVELATAAETTTGADAGRAVTPDGLAGSDYGKRIFTIRVIERATALTTGNAKESIFIPSELNGWNLVGAHACVSTVSSSGLPTIQVYNTTDSVDMLSTAITIDENEKTSYDAATPPVIDTDHDDVATGDEVQIDVDGAGTGTKGLVVFLVFQLP